MRPIYESAKDRERERFAAGILEREWRIKARKQEGLASIDYRLELPGGEVVALAEVKYRPTPYPSIFLSLKKAPAIRQAERNNLDVWYCILRDDGLYSTRIDPQLRYPRQMGGRRDRGDPDDIEELALVPWSDFTVVALFEASRNVPRP
jgi:hypothetical protein